MTNVNIDDIIVLRVKEIKKILEEIKMENMNNRFDSILDGFSIDDLMLMVNCNEKEVNEKTIKKCFEELMKIQIEEAREMLNQKMKFMKGCK